MHRPAAGRRVLAALVGALVGAAISIGAVSYAQGNASPKSPAAAASTPGGILTGVHQALENLVTNGTITQGQADAVQRLANTGSIDPKALVQTGVLDDAQMRTVGESITQVKQSYGR